jgi:hypothetical protein
MFFYSEGGFLFGLTPPLSKSLLGLTLAHCVSITFSHVPARPKEKYSFALAVATEAYFSMKTVRAIFE